MADAKIKTGINSVLAGAAINFLLAGIKAFAGIAGNSYALIADAIESTSDIFTSILIYYGLRFSRKPADANHPYGHGKFEPLIGAVAALILIAAAIMIAVESIVNINTPHESPQAFTLVVLIAVVLIKEAFARYMLEAGESLNSTAIKLDAWHHRSDAITSLMAFAGISISIIGGEGYESADDFAALFASVMIVINAYLLLKPAIYELTDPAPDPKLIGAIRQISLKVEGVLGTHKCNIRKLGFDYFVDLDILCDPDKTIREGHEIAHNVGDEIHKELPIITKVLVHVEPADDYGRR